MQHASAIIYFLFLPHHSRRSTRDAIDATDAIDAKTQNAMTQDGKPDLKKADLSAAVPVVRPGLNRAPEGRNMYSPGRNERSEWNPGVRAKPGKGWRAGLLEKNQ